MKKLILLIAFAIMISCQTEQVGVKFTTESLRKELITKSPSELKEAFNALSPELKRDLWRDRLIMESEFYNGEQKEYLVLVAKLQRVSAKFDPQNAKAKIIELFGTKEANRILTTLYLPNEKYIVEYSLLSAKTDPIVCNCSPMSDWCDFQFNSGQPNESWYCSSTCTEQSVAGCGTLFIYACQGVCQTQSIHS